MQAVERLGILLVEMREPEAALHHLERVANEYPREESLVALGRAYIDVGRPDRAVAPLQRALQLTPARTDAQFYLGLALTELGHGADAIPLLEEAVRQDSVSGHALAALSLAYAKVGRAQEGTAAALAAAQRGGNDAAELFRQALVLKPDYPPARRAMDALEQPR